MSQSPGEANDSDSVSAYLQNWDTLGLLIARGQSFSGRERNCCFLNPGQSSSGRVNRFADISAAANLDLIDDCRGVAAVDWDQDGDVDLWQTTRTAPSIRFLRNNLDSPNRSITVSLEGRRGNRDGIGARVQIELEGASPRRLIQTLRAGDAFLSQSSKSLHFGLGPSAAIRSVSVIWPGENKAETFAGVTEPGRYRLVEGTGVALPITQHNSRITALRPSVPSPPEPTDAARVVLTRRVKLSDLHYLGSGGRQLAISNENESPILITLWASWCAPCVTELTELKASATLLQQNGLRIFALSTDSLVDADGRNDLAGATNLMKQLDLPFATGFVSKPLMRQLHVLHTNLFYHEKPLPIPSSFLVDQYGNLAIVYRGAIDVAQLNSDVELIHTSDAQKIAAAVYPLGGRSGIGILPVDGLGFSEAYFEGGYYDDARREVLNFIERRTNDGPPRSVTDAIRAKLPDAYHQLARTEEAANRLAPAITAYRRALEFSPEALGSRVSLARALRRAGKHREAEEELRQAELHAKDSLKTHSLLARTRAQWGQSEQAIEHYEKAIQLDPKSQVLRLELAVALRDAGRIAEAIAEYKQLVADDPRLTPAANNLAWLFATHPDRQVRNGPQALQLARRICHDTKFQEPAYLDTLAAAFAEVGRFSEAAATARQAIQLADKRKQQAMADDIRNRLRLYEQQTAYRADDHKATN